MAWQYDWTNTYHAHYTFESNAPLALGVMQQAGWTYNAAIGVIGNLEQESGINPGQWQGGYNVGDWDNGSCGFGIAQWTPGRKYAIYIGYPTGSPPLADAVDGDRQMQFLITEPSQWSTYFVDMNTGYSSYYGVTVPILPTMASFAASNASIEDLTAAWMVYWERPSNVYAALSNRIAFAQHYAGITPSYGTNYWLYKWWKRKQALKRNGVII